MGGAEFVIQLSQLQQCGWMLAQLQSCFKTDRVDDKMGMDVCRIAVGGYQHFVPGPRLRCKLQSDLMGLLVGDILFRGEGLHILVEAYAAIFIPRRLGGFKLRDRVDPVAVDTADPADTALFIPGFLFLHAVIHDPLHIAGPLPGLLDISDGRQINHPG